MLESAGAQDHADLNVGLAAGVTDRGVRHQRNEDAIALASVHGPEGPVPLVVVSDGVSSSPRPDEASLAAVRAAIGILASSAEAGEDMTAASAAAVRAAADALAELAESTGGVDAGEASEAGVTGGGAVAAGVAPAATYVSAVLAEGTVTVCWLGDSRAYWLAAESAECELLTRDDSLAEELVAAGLASPEEAMATPQAHVITRWLGADMPEPEPHIAQFQPPGTGVLLLCSDGLWNYCPEAADLGVLVPFPAALTDPPAAAAALVKFALDAGGMDNVTVALIPFPPAQLPRTTASKCAVSARRAARTTRYG
jgi:serine/threonine protein phosphatase PrpC